MYAKLAETVRLRKEIEDKIEALEAPIKAELATKTRALRDLLRDAKAEEEKLRTECEASYLRDYKALEGLGGTIDLPKGVSVVWGQSVAVTDPGLLPRVYLAPDMKAIAKATGDIPGTHRYSTVSFRISR